MAYSGGVHACANTNRQATAMGIMSADHILIQSMEMLLGMSGIGSEVLPCT